MRALIVDLNNFAMYPTISVGYITAILRRAGVEVEVLSPLAHRVPGIQREAPPRPFGHLEQALRYWSATTPLTVVRALRNRAASLKSRRRGLSRLLVSEVERRIKDRSVDVILVSTYLQYFGETLRLGAICARGGMPLILGGSYLNQPEVGREWISIPGVSAIVAGEVEPELPHIVRAIVEGRSTSEFEGVWTRETRELRPAPPLEGLDSIPFPSYVDFPWHLYPNRIVPILAGRGCGWGVCTFCSDITSATGRSFRSRSAENVLRELEFQFRTVGARHFVFTDLKLNSDLVVWRTLLTSLQSRVPGATWVGAVHVGSRGENGLSKDDLSMAREAGMARLTTGLESGSQKILDAMAKGTSLEQNSQFLRNASDAQISVRVTLIVGYPGETAEDVRQTTSFLRAHSSMIERVTLNRFTIMTGTTIERRLRSDRGGALGVSGLMDDHRNGVVHQTYRTPQPGYLSAVFELITLVDSINGIPLVGDASTFDGVM
jgi:anaerobic magnesium-protoporphyrin IX monomethyl ester cyclase